MLSSVRPVRSLSLQRMPNPRSDTYPADSFADGTGSGPGPTRFNRPHLISCKHIHHVSRQRASPPADLAVRGRDGCTRFAHPNHPGGRAEHRPTSPTRSGCAASRTRRRRRPNSRRDARSVRRRLPRRDNNSRLAPPHPCPAPCNPAPCNPVPHPRSPCTPAPTTIHRTAAIRSHCARRRRQPKNSHREAVTFRGAEHRSTSPRRSGRAAGSARRRRRPKGQSPRSGVLSRLFVREGSAAGDADFCVGEVGRQAVGVVEPALWEDDVVAGAALAAAGGAEFGDRERDVAVELLQQLVQPGE